MKNYPYLLSKAYDLVYEFKAAFESKIPEEVSVYNQLDPASEERNFSIWEQMYQIVYPVDWYESSFFFNYKVKMVYQASEEERKVRD